jgi:hypothetical protein
VCGRVWSERWLPAEQWLLRLEGGLRARGALVERGGDFDRWDLRVRGGLLGSARVLSTVEEHGAGRQLVRLKVWPRVAPKAAGLALLFALLAVAAWRDGAEHAALLLSLAAYAFVARSLFEGGVARVGGRGGRGGRAGGRRPGGRGAGGRPRRRHAGGGHGRGRERRPHFRRVTAGRHAAALRRGGVTAGVGAYRTGAGRRKPERSVLGLRVFARLMGYVLRHKARARRRSSRCSRGSTTRWRAASRSTATTCATSR